MEKKLEYIYQNMVSDIYDGLLFIDFDGVITYLNDSAKCILGKKSADLLGKKFARCFFTYEENDGFNQAILNAIYNKNSFQCIEKYYDGTSTKLLRITASFLHDNGERIGILVVLSDISELEELRDAVKAMKEIQKLNSQLEMRNKLLSATFGRFLSDDIVKELLDTPGGLQIGGKKRNVTVMMCDLRGFTKISENLEPTRLIDMLNHYMAIMGDIIVKNKGTIIEILGDGILNVFGAPVESDCHALNAVTAAIEMQAAMPEINEWNKNNGYPNLEMGIGINTGETIVGNIGSERHTRYGVIGKHVNLCGRIEGYTIGGQILISPITKSLINEPLIIENEFTVLPKGIETPIVLYDVTGIGGDYNIKCPDKKIDLKKLKNKIDVEFFELKGKFIDNTAYKGTIVASSKTFALLVSEKKLNDFANIKFNVANGIFAKVIKYTPDGYMICFTSEGSEYFTES